MGNNPIMNTDVLGDTLGAVAREKAGIVKDGSRVVSWPQEPQAGPERQVPQEQRRRRLYPEDSR